MAVLVEPDRQEGFIFHKMVVVAEVEAVEVVLVVVEAEVEEVMVA
jgi:hypothetical protein